MSARSVKGEISLNSVDEDDSSDNHLKKSKLILPSFTDVNRRHLAAANMAGVV